MSETSPAPITPDAKDWTWVTERPCPDCGFDPGPVTPATLPPLVVDAAERFARALERRDADVRPAPGTWSPIEYTLHVADVCEVMTARLHAILDSDGAGVEFDDWDQDRAAVDKEYWKSNSHAAQVLVHERAEGAARAWAEVAEDRWEWPGLRSNGSAFTVASLARYFAHDVVHHLHDVGA